MCYQFSAPARVLVFVPSFWYSAIALLCWRSSFAHLPKLSCAEVFPSSRFSCTISFLRTWHLRALPDVGVGSLLYRTHS